MRQGFDEQLTMLKAEMVKMGSLCELVIVDAVNGFLNGDDSLLDIAVETDYEIDAKEREIEGLCFKLMIKHQPVANDMRAISSALKMITDMERIGDQASDIADIARVLEGDDSKSKTHLKQMLDSATAMVTGSIRSFVENDLELARKVMKDDDTVDAEFNDMRDDLIKMMKNNEAEPGVCIDLIMIAKYLERIGDHAVNIAEWVEYTITGVHISEELRDQEGRALKKLSRRRRLDALYAEKEDSTDPAGGAAAGRH
ncbi:MAG: phosphate signaling complex protein PhoU [Anaerovoracaceae bacterium]